VMYDELYDMLVDAGAQPETILGGMTTEEYSGRQEWFDAHPEFTFWDAPKGTPGHTDDAPMPPFAYRIPGPAEVSEPEDLYRHVADSSIIVTPGVPVQGIPDAKPEGRFITPAWEFNPTRSFLAESDDFSVPEFWRKQVVWEGDPMDNLSAAERIALIEGQILDIHLPAVAAGTVRFSTAAEITALYREVEPCLDLVDDQDLSEFVEER